MGSTHFFFDCKKEMGGMIKESYTKYGTMKEPGRRLRPTKDAYAASILPSALCALHSALLYFFGSTV